MLSDQFLSSSQPQTVSRPSADLQQTFKRPSKDLRQNSFMSNQLKFLSNSKTIPRDLTKFNYFQMCCTRRIYAMQSRYGSTEHRSDQRQTGNQRTCIYLDRLTVMRSHHLSCGFKRRRHGGHLDSRGRVCGKL